MKLLHAPDHALYLPLQRQERGPKVERALLLPEARSGHHADTRCIQQLEAVHEVHLHVAALCFHDGLVGEVDFGEEVHGAFAGVARHAGHVVEGLLQLQCLALEAGVNAVVLLCVRL